MERKGAFSVNGLQAQEFLATGLQEDNDEPRYNFEMYINEMTASYKTPGFILTLDNQRMPPTSYSKGKLSPSGIRSAVAYACAPARFEYIFSYSEN
jgi:hypothetical protein